MKYRLDQLIIMRKMTATRSQAESYIKMGKVTVDGKVVTKPGHFVNEDSKIVLNQDEQFVSRAALKLKSVADKLNLDFAGKVVLDVGSSTGGFTEFALTRGASKVVAVDVGTNQMHPSLRQDKRVELHEKTDIREFKAEDKFDIILIDVSFISSRKILPCVAKCFASPQTQVVLMLKPQFETGRATKTGGVVKNDTERRRIIRDFEIWAKQYFIIENKTDSEIAGTHGNLERFYLLKIIKH